MSGMTEKDIPNNKWLEGRERRKTSGRTGKMKDPPNDEEDDSCRE
jgi:hypothetical protein